MNYLTEQQKTEMFGEIGTPMRTLYEEQMDILRENKNELETFTKIRNF